MANFESTFEYKLIYVFRINDIVHDGLLKIGDATIHTTKTPSELSPKCKDLNAAAKERINSYTKTASIEYDLLYTELAIKDTVVKGYKTQKYFRDKSVHNVLIRSGIPRHVFKQENAGTEWFKTDLQTAINAIQAVKAGRLSLTSDEISEDNSPVVFRPEQKEAIQATIKQFKVSDRMLWNAKMRFGKTLTALEVAKEMGFKKTLIFTHRPVVSDGWFDDFNKIFKDTDYVFGSKTKGETIENLADSTIPFVYFASIQDLRGSQAVGGKFEKNEFVYLIDWDFVVVDEAHEGTQTTLGQKVIDAVIDSAKPPKMLELSGTPFNLISSFKENEIFTWDYIMEQKAKIDWPLQHFGDSNPYEELPKLEIFTYNLDKSFPHYKDIEDDGFNFREFFRTWTGDVKKDFKPMPEDVKKGDFVNKDDVQAFLNLLTKKDDNNNYPFSTETYRSYYKHTLWMVPGVKEAKALSALLKAHPIFGKFNIVNVAGAGDEEVDSSDALKAVRNAIGKNPDENYSITISCGRLTTGVTVPEWTAVFMLYGSFSTGASSYLQTIFRVQSPANINGRMKERCSVFDFAPDRTLKMVAEAGNLSSKTGNTSNDRVVMGEFLNFCPVISIEGSNMLPYNVDGMLQQLKKAYTDRVVKNGFDDKNIYNDNLLKLDELELKEFEKLKEIVGASKPTASVKEIEINDQGFTNEEYAEIERIEKKPKKERTPEELALLAEKKKKREAAQKAMSILRGISIRIPLLIYGADVPIDKEITVENFIELIDDASWNEFMPNGVTKELYKQFSKYYEQDIFVAAGRQIRKLALSADDLSPLERTMKIASLFAMFKNPDKETVLTPWRVVNMHLSDTLGGYCFYNEKFDGLLEEPRFVDQGDVTQETLSNTNAKILEINSKTGLYPLYATYSIYAQRLDAVPENDRTFEKQYELWEKTVKDNIYVICKTPMAKAITRRTLLGYRNGKINAHAFDDLINQLKEKPQQFRDKVLRGNTWGKQELVMKFDAIIGNPPYQETLSSGDSSRSLARQLFPDFIKNSILLKTKYCSLITPSRWFAGEAQDGSFVSLRDFMKQNNHITKLVNFNDAKDVFNNVIIKGGISYFLYDKNYTGKVSFSNVANGRRITQIRDLFEEGLDVILSNSEIYNIIQKVKINSFISLTTITKGRNAFGIVGKQEVIDAITVKEPQEGYIKIQCKGGEIRYTNEKNVTKSIDVFNSYKVFISKSAGDPASDTKVIGKPYYAEPKMACSDSLIPIGKFDNKDEALNLQKYLKTVFVRFMISILKVSQNVYQNVYQFVPMQNFKNNSDIEWTKSIENINTQLYKKYGFTNDEISLMESTVKPMD